MGYTVVWFKRDLRVHDHAPLAHAAAHGPVLCLYVLEPSLWTQPDSALQHYQFLRESLRDLAVARWCRRLGVAWQEWPQHGVVRRLPSREQWHGLWQAHMQAPCLPPPLPASLRSVSLPWRDTWPAPETMGVPCP